MEFEKEYIGSRPQAIRNLWESFHIQSLEGFSQWLALFLGTVAKFITDEEQNLVELFSEIDKPRIENLVLIEALMPMKRSLADRLQRIDSPQVTFECYCVADEFMKRMLAMVNTSLPNEKLSTMETVFGGFIKHIPQMLESEDRCLKNKIAVFLTLISFSGDRSYGEFEYEKDPIEEIHQFVDNFMSGSEEFATYCVDVLHRCTRIFGGVNVKQIVRIVVNALQTVTKMLIIKMANFAVALGLSGIQSNEALSQSETKLSEPYPNYSEECKIAARLGCSILSTEGDRQALTICVLKSLQAVGVYIRSLSTVETVIRTICLETHKRLSSITDELDTGIKKIGGCGGYFGFYLVNKDENQLAELKSFLVANSQNFGQGMFSVIFSVSKKLVFKVEEFVLQLSTGVPSKLLSSYSSEEIWGKVVGEGELNSCKQNLLPQSAVTQVSDLLSYQVFTINERSLSGR